MNQKNMVMEFKDQFSDLQKTYDYKLKIILTKISLGRNSVTEKELPVTDIERYSRLFSPNIFLQVRENSYFWVL